MLLYFSIKNQDRQLSLDLIRLASALAIILIHTVSLRYFDLDQLGYKNWIVSASLGWLVIWGTPLFVMVSGYLLIGSAAKTNATDFWKKRFHKLAIPLIFWNIFYYLFNHHSSAGSVVEFFSQLFASGTASHLYFLNIMVGLYLLTPFLTNYLSKTNLKIVVPILILLSAFYHYSYSFLGFPRLNNIFIWFIPYLGYYLAGYLVGNLPTIKHFKIISSLIVFIFLLSIFVTRKLVFIFETHDQDTILVSNLSLPVAGIALLIFYFLSHLSNNILQKHSHVLLKLSNLTFGVYLIHPFWLEILKNISITSYWPWFLSVFILAVLLSFSSVWLLSKIPYVRHFISTSSTTATTASSSTSTRKSTTTTRS